MNKLKNPLKVTQSALSNRLLHSNRYNILDSKYIQKQKQKFFTQNEKTLVQKSKFFLKEMKYTLVEGCKELKNDTKWLINLYNTKNEQEMTGYQICKKRRVVSDLLKFIPYSVIIAIPAAEVFLPLILWLCPNAIPSFFIFDTKHQQKLHFLQKRQQQSHSFLYTKLTEALRQAKIRQDQYQDYQNFQANFMKISRILETDARYNYNNFSSEELLKVLDFLGGDYYTGTRTINKFAQLFTRTIPRICLKIYYNLTKTQPPQKQPNSPSTSEQPTNRTPNPLTTVLQPLKRQYLLYQIKQKYKILKKQDQSFHRHGFDDLQGESVKCFARERGLPSLSCYESLRNVVRNQWVGRIYGRGLEGNGMGLGLDHVKFWYSVMLYQIIAKNNREQN